MAITKNSGALHPRNPHQGRYDFNALVKAMPSLNAYLQPNPTGDSTINFGDVDAVRCLNKALLAHFYQVDHWQVPAGYLCPPIPGRTDYIHYLADLLGIDKPDSNRVVHVLDIGTGANCIYPIIGSQSYGWHFVGTESDKYAAKAAQKIIDANSCLKGLVKIRDQVHNKAFFKNVVKESEYFDACVCNPPFFASMKEANAQNIRKQRNLSKISNPVSASRNFSGHKSELVCHGGELGFLKRMATESVGFCTQVGWFTSLVSNKDNIKPLRKHLSTLGAKSIVVVPMYQGQKASRFIAWQY